MLKLSKKQYKILLKDMLSSTYPNTVKVHIDFDNELIYFLNPETDMIWYLEGDLTTVVVNQSWSLLPKAMLKQANKVILADKHYVIVEPVEEEGVQCRPPVYELDEPCKIGVSAYFRDLHVEPFVDF